MTESRHLGPLPSLNVLCPGLNGSLKAFAFYPPGPRKGTEVAGRIPPAVGNSPVFTIA